MLSTEVFAPEPAPLRRRLGAGSFASVDVVQEGPCAYKSVHDPSGAEELYNEYASLQLIHRTCDPDSFFVIPQPYAFCNLATNSLLVAEPPQVGQPPHRRPFFSLSAFHDLGFIAPTYVMDRIHSLPQSVGFSIKTLFYNEEAMTATIPSLCRLYFGVVLDGPATRPSRFFNSANFPLDTFRYTALADPLSMPAIETVAAGIGEMLAHIHWNGGADGRDVEFVMGGDGFHGVQFFMRAWNKTIASIPLLVSAFTANDPYYPAPRPGDPLYQAFRKAYVNMYPKDSRVVAYAFLKCIEDDQALRDNTSSRYTSNYAE
ncbi:hypothetical protein FPV67DRAFT_1562051 [Lyophyllum atratum]|nr:hypothetical protein FPV67DRAFT_1562051 [Lyophyllum atratum]